MLFTSKLFFPYDRLLRSQKLHRSRGVAASGFPPLRKIPYCCLPQKSGPYLNPSVADHPLRPATDHGLGKPLPYQQANRTQAHPKVRAEARFNNCIPKDPLHYSVLAPVSRSYPNLQGRLPTRYSPVRQFNSIPKDTFSLTCLYKARRQRSS